MSDFMYLMLSISVTFNMLLMFRLSGAHKALMSVDRLLKAVSKGEAKIVLGDDDDWHVERVK